MLFSMAALALAAYGAWQITDLRRDMISFKNEVRAEIVKVRVAADAGPTRGELLSAARQHSQRAAELMRHGDVEGAKGELEASQDCLERAGGSSLVGAKGEVSKAWESVRREVGQLWKEFAEQSVKEARKNESSR